MTIGMEFPSRSETPEMNQDKTQEVGEVKPEALETSKQVEQATFEPEAVVERGDFQQAEAIEAAFVKAIDVISPQLEIPLPETDLSGSALETKSVESQTSETNPQNSVTGELIEDLVDVVPHSEDLTETKQTDPISLEQAFTQAKIVSLRTLNVSEEVVLEKAVAPSGVDRPENSEDTSPLITDASAEAEEGVPTNSSEGPELVETAATDQTEAEEPDEQAVEGTDPPTQTEMVEEEEAAAEEGDEAAMEAGESEPADQTEGGETLTYTVSGTGESLQSIADQFGITVEDLMAANPDIQDTGTGLDQGTELVIPLGEADSAAEEGEPYQYQPMSFTETIESELVSGTDYETDQPNPGESILDFAYRNGITPELLLLANPDLTTGVETYGVGTWMIIPKGEYAAELEAYWETLQAEGVEVDPSVPLEGREYSYYSVLGNETPQSIADSYGISLEVLLLANPNVDLYSVVVVGSWDCIIERVIIIPLGNYAAGLEAQVAATQAESGETETPIETDTAEPQVGITEEGDPAADTGEVEPTGDSNEASSTDQTEAEEPDEQAVEGTDPLTQTEMVEEEENQPVIEEESEPIGESDSVDSGEPVLNEDYISYSPSMHAVTLKYIAEMFGTSEYVLLLANPGIDRFEYIHDIEDLMIPQGEYAADLETQAASLLADGSTQFSDEAYYRYTVINAGITLGQIAINLGIPLDVLSAANPGIVTNVPLNNGTVVLVPNATVGNSGEEEGDVPEG